MFSRVGTYLPVGLFSRGHIISIFACLLIIVLAVILTRKMKKETYIKMLKVFAFVFTTLELFKIIWTWSNGNFYVNSWVPLYFCSLFIYALWLTSSKNKFLHELGLSFIACANIIAGLVFIFFPTTSFNSFPLFHFQCIYSMLYHTTMVYSGIMFHRVKPVKMSVKFVLKYLIFCILFMQLAIIINAFTGGNLMFLSHPGGVPIEILKTIHRFSDIVYTFVMVAVHMSMGFVVMCVDKVISLFKTKKLNLEDEEEITESKV